MCAQDEHVGALGLGQICQCFVRSPFDNDLSMPNVREKLEILE
jgi:hypothetical protein